MQKRFDEYFAKVVLESCFPKQFIDLQIADKPDLRSGKKIGIEVTNCMPQRVAEAFNLWHKVETHGEQTPPRILERLEQLDEVQLDEGGLLWNQGTYSDDVNIDQTPIKDFLNAVYKKIERLNSCNANYTPMEHYELFVNSAILIPKWFLTQTVERLNNINQAPKRFDRIYLIVNEQKLLIFDLIDNTVDIKYLYTHLERMAQRAYQLYEAGETQ